MAAQERKAGDLTEDQLRYLWRAYRDEQHAGGPARDGLPYTRHFENILARMNAHFKKAFDGQELWRALSDLDKSPDRRGRLGCPD